MNPPTIGRGRASLMPTWLKQQQLEQQQLQQPGAVAVMPPPALPVVQQQHQPVPVFPPPVYSAPQNIPGASAVQGFMTFLPLSAQASIPPTPMSTGGWVETQTPDGKVYYSNTISGETTYEKPDQLKTAVERQLPSSPWKEYVREGKSYYVNSITKESSWEEPMDFTMHRERLRFICAGEPPSRDMNSLAVYHAAEKALVDLIVDVDGSLAARRAEDEARALESEERAKEEALTARPTVVYTEVSSELKRPTPLPMGAGKDTFLQMLSDWNIPKDSSWDDMLQRGIAADPRYNTVATLAEKKKLVEDRRARAPPRASEADTRHKLKDEFLAFLDELEAKQAIGPRSVFASLQPVFELNLARLPEDARDLFEDRVDDLYRKKKREREEVAAAQEAQVHEAIGAHVEGAEKLPSEELFALVSVHLKLPEEVVRKHCVNFVKRKAELREQAIKQAEAKVKEALAAAIRKAFASGALSVDARWAEFRQDEDLKASRAPYLAQALMPLAGKELVVENTFRKCRDDAGDEVDSISRVMQDKHPGLATHSRRGDLTGELLEVLKAMDEEHGKALVDRALQSQARRFVKSKEKFFDLLSRYVREKRDAVWDRVEPQISDRTAYRDLGTDEARRKAFDEFVAKLSDRRGGSSRRRSRSPRRRRH